MVDVYSVLGGESKTCAAKRKIRDFAGDYRRIARCGLQSRRLHLLVSTVKTGSPDGEKNVLPELIKDGIGLLGMKSMGDGLLLKSKTVTPVECLHYAMTLPTSTVITGIDSLKILKQGLEAVKTFQPLTDNQLADLLARTRSAASEGRFEGFKTTNGFDGTAKNPRWLETADKTPG